MRKIKNRSTCGISSTLDLIGDKWSLLIIRDIMFNGKRTYGDFLNSAEKISTNILAERLLLLESNGFIVKKIHPENKSKFLYSLSPRGIDLMPVLLEIILWSDKYLKIPDKGRAFAEKIRKDREGLIAQLLKGLE